MPTRLATVPFYASELDSRVRAQVDDGWILLSYSLNHWAWCMNRLSLCCSDSFVAGACCLWKDCALCMLLRLLFCASSGVASVAHCQVCFGRVWRAQHIADLCFYRFRWASTVHCKACSVPAWAVERSPLHSLLFVPARTWRA